MSPIIENTDDGDDVEVNDFSICFYGYKDSQDEYIIYII